MNKVKFDDFNLKSVAVSKSMVTADFVAKKTVGGENVATVFNVKSPHEPHPDLIECMQVFRVHLASAYGLTTPFAKVAELTKKMSKKETEKLEQLKADIVANVEVTKLSIGGLDTAQGAVISGKLKSFNGSKIALNTPRIVFESNKIGIESEVKKLVDVLIEEVYDYLFENKRAQLEIGFDAGDKKQEPTTEAEHQEAV